MDLQPLTVESDESTGRQRRAFDFRVASWGWLMHPGMDAAGRAPLIVRAIKRIWVRFGVTQLTKR
jgi:hypothetical protein